jgi:protein-disulfide isomerase
MSTPSKRARERKAVREKQQHNRQITVISLVMVVAVVALMVYASGGFGTAEIPPELLERYERDPYLGAEDAPVTLMEYAAFGCEACKQWHNAGVVEQILEEFPGQVRYIFRDMPIIMPAYSQMAAEVAQCAFDQGNDAYWLMHNALYEQLTMGASTQEQMILVGGALGLDGANLRTCVEAGTHVETVRYDLKRGQSLGIRGAPTWFVNDQRIFEASPATLRQAIQQALLAAGA